MCKNHNTEIIQISSQILTKTVQEELAEDLCAIIHSFSGKLYGLRKNQLKDINENIKSIKEVNNYGEDDIS
jgi:predicted site-specific integrase-resolvase